LAGRQPQQLWFAHLLLHRVEALVRVAGTLPLDRWQRALLHLVRARTPGGGLESSLADLHLDGQVMTRLVGELTAAGLLHQNGTGRWDLTAAGRHALESGARDAPREERRTFYFVDRTAAHRPPHFLPLRRPPSLPAAGPAPEAAGGPFDLSALEECLRQTPPWKAAHHFPADVEALLPPHPDEPPDANWRRVVLDALEQPAFVFVRTAGPAVLGFPVRSEGWAREVEPALELAAGWEEVLPELAAEPPPEAWRQAWQTWAHPRGLPPAEVEACRLERAEHRLVVHAPPRLIDRLRAARSDAVKQEAWLLAGAGRTRLAAQIDLRPL
jgi:hypothetical protein